MKMDWTKNPRVVKKTENKQAGRSNTRSRRRTSLDESQEHRMQNEGGEEGEEIRPAQKQIKKGKKTEPAT